MILYYIALYKNAIIVLLCILQTFFVCVGVRLRIRCCALIKINLDQSCPIEPLQG